MKDDRRFSSLRSVWVLVGALLVTASCTTPYRQSVGADNARIYSRIFLCDYNSAWQAVLESTKSVRMDVLNREGGFLQSKWTDNTTEKTFVDSFGGADAYLKAQYRMRISVAKSFFNGKPAVKVTVQKEQMTQRDVLEGWKAVETDSLEENTLLYRIGRIIYMRLKLAKIEEEKTKKALEAAGVSSP